MGTRCKKCIFKDIQGNRYPCNECNEIMDLRSMKYMKNHFQQINEDKNNKSKERLSEKLNNIAASFNREVLYKEYKVMENKNMKLTAFLNYGNDIIICQIIDTGNKLTEKVLPIEKELLCRIRRMW